MKLLPSLAIIALLSGCSAPSIRSSDCGGTAGTFSIPAGWSLPKIEGPSESENILKAEGHTSDQDPSITLDVSCHFDPKFPKTQAGCSASYLKNIRSANDPLIASEKAGSIHNDRHGEIKILRFHSKWYGDHLVAMIVTPTRHAKAELWADSKEERQRDTSGFEEFVKGIRLPLD